MGSTLHERIYHSQPAEHELRVDRVDGTIPPELTGTLLRSGPGLLRVGADPLNFFDGHALIAGVSFGAGAAVFRSRYVRTPLYEAELTTGAVVKRRVFTNKPSRWSNLFVLDLGNNAMHDVYAWGDGDARRVIAANDPGHFALDPRTLATRGPERWGDSVERGQEMSPMPYRDPATGHLIAWVKKVGGIRPDSLRFVELDGAFRVVKATPFHALAASPIVVHDHRATARWYVTVEQAARLSVPSAIWGARTVYESFQAPPGATATLLLVRRGGDGSMVRVPLRPPVQTAFHIINAYDDGDHVIVDLITYDGRIRFEAAAPADLRERTGYRPSHGPIPTPTRLVVDPRDGCILQSTPLGTLPGEAPEVRDDRMGAPYRFAWYPTPSVDEEPPDRGGYFYYGALARLDVQTGESRVWTPGGAIVSPCAFVARPSGTDEDDGWLLTWLLRESGAQVAILDARSMEPVATLDLGIHLPGISHVRWEDVQLDA